ncbi:hypothetical protein [Pelomonas sp. KK5]|uniref:hypothetical protein n=1 Tax=Pelomonas sp. KK5 TaxID=1855730 RepID=UPI00097BEA92|nr:hypothetical protein [Pelomonas sp. KK5]
MFPPRRLLLRLLPLTLGLAALRPAAAVEVEQITWLLSARPGGEATEESRMGDALRDFIEAAWPQPHYIRVPANARRAWQLIEQGERVCQSSSIRTAERERIAYFADTLLGPPLQLIVRGDMLASLPRTAAGEADLPRLLAEAKLRGALVDGRSYGRSIDAMLTMPGPALTRYASSDFGSQIQTMLALGRADWTIGFDAELSQAQRRAPALRQLRSLPIAGNAEMVRAGIACPRNAWGLAAIQGIERVLGTPTGAALLKQQALYWLTPETRGRYAAQFDEFYRERAKPAAIR